MRGRTILGGAVAAVLSVAGGAVGARPAAGEAPPEGTYRYRVLRNGDAIGSHRVEVRARGDRLAVQHDVRLRVSIAGWDAFTYQMSSAEFWSGDRLTRLTAHTNRNGTALSVVARPAGAHLVVRGAREARAPLDAVPASPAWNVLGRRPTTMIDAESGEAWRVRVSEGRSETVRAGAGAVEARCYQVRGDLEATLCYGARGMLVRKRLTAPDGSTVEEVLR